MGLSTYIWRGGDISPQEFPAPMMHSLSGDLLFCQKKRGICGYVTISPQGFPAPMMHCTMRRPSFTLVKEGKTNQRSAFGIPQPLHGASVDFFLKVAFSSSPLPFNVQRLVRSAVLHKAQTFYKCVTFCGCHSANLHFSSSRRLHTLFLPGLGLSAAWFSS